MVIKNGIWEFLVNRMISKTGLENQLQKPKPNLISTFLSFSKWEWMWLLIMFVDEEILEEILTQQITEVYTWLDFGGYKYCAPRLNDGPDIDIVSNTKSYECPFDFKMNPIHKMVVSSHFVLLTFHISNMIFKESWRSSMHRKIGLSAQPNGLRKV